MTAAPFLDRLSAIADPTRSRLLLVLDGHELAVSELCQVVQLPQSTVSRHLKILGDEGWVSSRADGASRQYTIDPRLDEGGRRIWSLVREQLAATATTGQDRERLRGVLDARRARSQEFFSSAAHHWESLRTELFGERADLAALLGLLDDRWVVGDLGCGVGQVTAALAPFVARVVAVDESPAMLAAARARLDGVANVELRSGALERLPIEDGALDAAVLCLVLPYLAEPPRVLAEARRVLRPGGRLLVADMTPHDHVEYRQGMGHLWQGFDEPQLAGWLAGAGFTHVRYHRLAADPRAKGPQLFAATARAG